MLMTFPTKQLHNRQMCITLLLFCKLPLLLLVSSLFNAFFCRFWVGVLLTVGCCLIMPILYLIGLVTWFIPYLPIGTIIILLSCVIQIIVTSVIAVVFMCGARSKYRNSMNPTDRVYAKLNVNINFLFLQFGFF